MISSIALIVLLFTWYIGGAVANNVTVAATLKNLSENSQSESLAQLSSSSQSINKLHGIDFSPYMDGQNPEYGSKVSREQATERLTIIAPYTSWIRTYGTESGLEYIGPVAHEMGLKTAIGAWLSGDTEANDRQINELINESKAGYVDLAIVGSETLLRNDLTEDQLIKYIKYVKKAVPGVNVTTADTYDQLLKHPRVMAECDVIMYNSYPYWKGVSIDDAIEIQDNVYKSIADQVKNKSITVSETGWPSAGNTIGSAVPSPQNSTRYFKEFVSWARKNNVQYFYFEAFDESWKANNEGPQGARWGIWDKDGNMKPGMEKILLGKEPEAITLGANFSDNATPGKATNISEETVTKIQGSETGIINNDTVNEEQETEQKDSPNTPGFEVVYAVICLLTVFLHKRK